MQCLSEVKGTTSAKLLSSTCIMFLLWVNYLSEATFIHVHHVPAMGQLPQRSYFHPRASCTCYGSTTSAKLLSSTCIMFLLWVNYLSEATFIHVHHVPAVGQLPQRSYFHPRASCTCCGSTTSAKLLSSTCIMYLLWVDYLSEATFIHVHHVPAVGQLPQRSYFHPRASCTCYGSTTSAKLLSSTCIMYLLWVNYLSEATFIHVHHVPAMGQLPQRSYFHPRASCSCYGSTTSAKLLSSTCIMYLLWVNYLSEATFIHVHHVPAVGQLPQRSYFHPRASCTCCGSTTSAKLLSSTCIMYLLWVDYLSEATFIHVHHVPAVGQLPQRSYFHPRASCSCYGSTTSAKLLSSTCIMYLLWVNYLSEATFIHVHHVPAMGQLPQRSYFHPRASCTCYGSTTSAKLLSSTCIMYLLWVNYLSEATFIHVHHVPAMGQLLQRSYFHPRASCTCCGSALVSCCCCCCWLNSCCCRRRRAWSCVSCACCSCCCVCCVWEEAATEVTEEEDEGRGRVSESLGGEAWSWSCCSRAVCACCLSKGSSSVLEVACSNAKVHRDRSL